jgi:hypothetical protein
MTEIDFSYQKMIRTWGKTWNSPIHSWTNDQCYENSTNILQANLVVNEKIQKRSTYRHWICSGTLLVQALSWMKCFECLMTRESNHLVSHPELKDSSGGLVCEIHKIWRFLWWSSICQYRLRVGNWHSNYKISKILFLKFESRCFQ